MSLNPGNYLPEIGFVRLETILKIIPVGKTTWWKGVKSGRFPKPIKIGARVTAWRVEDIHLLIEQMGGQQESSQSNLVLEAQEKYDNLVKQFGVPLEDSLPEFGYPKAESNQG